MRVSTKKRVALLLLVLALCAVDADAEDDVVLDNLSELEFQNNTALLSGLKKATLTSLQYSVECGIQNNPTPFTKLLAVDEDPGRIVGGSDALSGEFPWQISLQKKWGWTARHVCGGSILSETIVITAAHCVQGSHPSQLQILAGADTLTYRSRFWQLRTIKKILTVGFDPNTIARDITLLVLDRPLQFDKKHVAPVCLPTANYIYNGKRGVISGWGTLSEGGRLAPSLQVVTVPFVPVDECRAAYGRDGDAVMITQCNICTGSKTGGLDSCQGDSGGPMTCVEDDGRHYLCGIVSWGTGCGDPKHPGVYTFTPCYANWIAQKVAQYKQ